MIRSASIRFNIIGAFLVATHSVSRNRNNPEFIAGCTLCENSLYDLLNDVKTRIDLRTIGGYCSTLMHYFNCLQMGMTFTPHKSKFLVDFFTNVNFNELPPRTFLIGYANLGMLQLYKRASISMHNEANIDYINHCIKKNLPPSKNNKLDDVDAEDDAVEVAVKNQKFGNSLIFKFIQASFIENSANWNNQLSLLVSFAEKMEKSQSEDAFRKWVVAYINEMNLQQLDFNQLSDVAKVMVTFLKGKGLIMLKLRFLKAYLPLLDKIKDNNKVCELLHLYVCFKPILNTSANVVPFKFDVDKEISEEDKVFIKKSFDNIVNRLIDPASKMNTVVGVQTLNHLLSTFSVFTAEDIKNMPIHRNVWDGVTRKTNLRAFIFDVFTAICNYDIVNDGEMQQVLVAVLNNNYSNAHTPDRKIWSLPKSFDKVFEKFDSRRDELSTESLAVLTKLESIKNQVESE
jgi:hypothetical protein